LSKKLGIAAEHFRLAWTALLLSTFYFHTVLHSGWKKRKLVISNQSINKFLRGNMSKHSFLSAAVLLTALLAACQPNPTRIDSTVHKPEGQSSTSHASNSHSDNHNGSIHTDANHNSTKRNPSEPDSTNHSDDKH